MKIGFTELILVVIVAFVVIGPDKLPEYARKLGKMLRELKKYTGAASEEIQKNVVEPLNEIQAPIKEAVAPLTDLKKDIEEEKKRIEELEKKASRSQRKEKLKSLSNAQLDAAMAMTPEMLKKFEEFMASQQK